MTEPKTKKCEVCGARKPLSDFSKSYKNRCRACVAAEARMHRASEAEELNRIKPKLKELAHRIGSRVEAFKKAQIRVTGEVVEVVPCESLKCTVPAVKTLDGRIIPHSLLQFTPEIDWEQRRYEIAKDIFVHRLTLPEERLSLTEEVDAEIAVDLADALIDALKAKQQ